MTAKAMYESAMNEVGTIRIFKGHVRLTVVGVVAGSVAPVGLNLRVPTQFAH